jgi:hypothetical protein
MTKARRKALKFVAATLVAAVLVTATVLVAGTVPVHAGGLPSLSGAAANEPPAKATLLQTQDAQANNAPRANKSDLAPIVNQPGTAPPGGILNVRQGPFPSAVFTVQNSWAGEIDGRWLMVYAGQSGPENQAAVPCGGVALLSQPLVDLDYGTGVQSLGYVTVPNLTRPLTVSSVSGDVMTLSDAQGTAYTFDLSSLTFGS